MSARATMTFAATMTLATMTLALLTLALMALVLTPATASATSRDIASTHAYIQANFALAQAGNARIASTQVSILHRTRQFGRECPQVGAGSPQNEESQKLSYEAAGALWSVSFGANAAPIRAFARAVKPLRWSNPKITRIAQDYAKSLLGLATLPAPDLCGDVRAWRASGFRTIPATTLRFDLHVESIEGHTVPPQLLAAYERPADRSALARTTHLEYELEANEFEIGVDDWDALLETLGLKQ